MTTKSYYHILGCNRRPSNPDRLWFHEFSADTREDARDTADGLRRDGYRVKIVRSAADPYAILKGLNS